MADCEVEGTIASPRSIPPERAISSTGERRDEGRNIRTKQNSLGPQERQTRTSAEQLKSQCGLMTATIVDHPIAPQGHPNYFCAEEEFLGVPLTPPKRVTHFPRLEEGNVPINTSWFGLFGGISRVLGESLTTRRYPSADSRPIRKADCVSKKNPLQNTEELGFQQDRATCHTARDTIDLLKDTLGDRLISRFGPVNWPPRSCDLTPLDYFLWGYVKSLVYADKPQTLDHLEDNIRRVIADIRPQMLEKVIENWTSRLDYIRASRGSHMPELIFKM
ncbi:transposable element Tc3 transposase [Trichonephila clavipes]|nr:transposable element Tc3 transposase [Trichonephila clavipes]